MENFETRLRELRRSRGKSQEEVGRIINVGKTTISNYEKGRSEPDNGKMIALAAFFDVSVDYLLGVSDIEKTRRWREDGIPYEVVKKMPIYDIQGPSLDEENIVDYIPVPVDLYDDNEYFAAKLSSGIMEIKKPCDVIYVFRHQDSCEDGNVALIKTENREMSVMEYYNNNGSIMLIMDNHPVFLKKDEPVKIFGVLVKVIVTL